MRKRARTLLCALVPALAFGLAGARPAAAAQNRAAFSAGIGFDVFTRTITWDNAPQPTKAKAGLITARGTVELKAGLTFELAAGLSLSSFNGLVLDRLPITIDYEAGAAKGLLLAGKLRAELARFGSFEIEGAGRFVYSLGFAKTRPLTDFTVEGSAKARPTWLEASLGPRISYRASSRFVPYLSVSADWFSGSLAVDETLADLTGHETKKVKGKGFMEVTLGADLAVARQFTLRAEAGLLPYAGGVDGRAAVGLFYRF